MCLVSILKVFKIGISIIVSKPSSVRYFEILWQFIKNIINVYL